MGNWKSIVLLLAATQGILLCIALIATSLKKRHFNLFLGFILFVFSIELLNAWGMQVKYHSNSNSFPFWLFGSYLILPPSIWLFSKTSIDPSFKVKSKHIWLYFPAFIEIFIQLFSFYNARITGIELHLMKYDIWFAFAEITPIFWTIGVLIKYGLQLKEFVKQYHLPTKNYAETLIKHRIFIIVLATLTVLWMIQSLFQLQVFLIIEVILATSLFILGYIVYFSPSFYESPTVVKNRNDEIYAHYNEAKELERFKVLFEQDKIYTKSRLSIEDLANELNLPDRYVSFLINSHHQTNFNNFVNAYRVKEVLRKLSDPKEKHKTLLGIALESGFSSKSSFNQVFKTHTGETPSSYLAKNIK